MADQGLWESFVSNHHLAPFLQSWYWGDFQERQGRQVHRVAYLRSGAVVAAAQGIITRTRFGTVYYVPYGPVLDWSDQALAKTFLQHLVGVAHDRGVDYLRIDPRVETSPATQAGLSESGFRRAPTFVQAEFDLVLDIGSCTEQQLLAGLRKTTRNLVRKATSIGVKIEVTENAERFDAFQRLLDATAERHKIVFQGRDYLRAQFEVLSRAGIGKLFIASYQDKPVAAAVIVFYGDNASYVHGASLARADVPASHLLQWAAVQEAQRRQFKYYSFWGIAPNEDPKHPLHGVSLFKRGFGGRSVTYVGAWDHSLRARYWLVWVVETVRRRVRRI